MCKKLVLLFFFSFFLFSSFAKERALKEKEEIKISDFEINVLTDFLDSMNWAYRGSMMQFQNTENLVFSSFSLLSTLYFIKNDKRISSRAVKKKKNEKLIKLISDSSIFFNTPVMPMLFYGVGASRKDQKMLTFSKEYFSAMTLALLETGLISAIPVHQRPDTKKLSFWEKAFRGQSSFPSGHVIGYSILGFKLFQFYGPRYAILPFALAFTTGFERVHAEKHFISDVVASGFISFLASQGVAYASASDKHHALYKWIFAHNFSLKYMRKKNTPGLITSFSF